MLSPFAARSRFVVLCSQLGWIWLSGCRFFGLTFTFPTFRTERERWGTGRFGLFLQCAYLLWSLESCRGHSLGVALAERLRFLKMTIIPIFLVDLGLACGSL
jgi:hypothetical protein